MRLALGCLFFLFACGTGKPHELSDSAWVWIPGGSFVMGVEPGSGEPDAQPAHRRAVKGFYLKRHEVTNREFAAFIEATSYLTDAEREGGGWVWQSGDWEWVEGAHWRTPVGAGTTWDARPLHPVVLVSWHDAMAYCAWRGERLPEEVEWEYAAGGRFGATYPFPGDSLLVYANTFQGDFPISDQGEDGFRGTAPVGSFRSGYHELFDMAGNVWEWTATAYHAREYLIHASGGMVSGSGLDPFLVSGTSRVIRGGSWLCSPVRCEGYRVARRMRSPESDSYNHLGFRTVRDN